MTRFISNYESASGTQKGKISSFLGSHGIELEKIDDLLESQGLNDERIMELAMTCHARVIDHSDLEFVKREVTKLVDFYRLLDPRNGKSFLYDNKVEKNFNMMMRAYREIAFEDFRFLENLEKKLGWTPSGKPGGSNYPWDKKQTRRRK